ncbi:MAG: DsbA family oxidoreductase [Pseudomonadota bacterium]
MSARPTVAIDFFADVSCPWCYVGWEAMKRAASVQRETFSVSVAWRTFLLSPDLPLEGVDRAQYLSHYSPEQLKASEAALRAAAAAAGAPFAIEKATRIPNTIDAHRVVHWAAEYGQAEGVIDTLFRAHFAEGQDISARDTLVQAAEANGLDPHEVAERLASKRDRDLILQFHAAAVRIGIQGVPLAVFNRRVPVMGAQSEAVYAEALAKAA